MQRGSPSNLLGGWKEETDMYTDIIVAIKTLYSSQRSVNVVDTSGLHEVPADASIAEY
jgi:hypothetical protein